MARNELIKAPGKTAAEFQKSFGPPPHEERTSRKLAARLRIAIRRKVI
jgi:hypothetical protein